MPDVGQITPSWWKCALMLYYDTPTNCCVEKLGNLLKSRVRVFNAPAGNADLNSEFWEMKTDLVFQTGTIVTPESKILFL